MENNKVQQPERTLPIYSEFARVQDRYDSGIINKWDSIIDKKEIKEYAEFGIFFKELGTSVCCYQCGAEIKWSADISLLFEHVRKSPHCYHLKDTVDPARFNLYKITLVDTYSLLVNGGNNGVIAQNRGADEQQLDQHATESLTDSQESQHAVDRVSDTLMAQFIDVQINEPSVLVRQNIDDLPTPALYDQCEELRGPVAGTLDEDQLQENTRLRRQFKCNQCNNNDKNALFLPCAHLFLCHACSNALQVCPLCGTTIKAKHVVYRY